MTDETLPDDSLPDDSLPDASLPDDVLPGLPPPSGPPVPETALGLTEPGEAPAADGQDSVPSAPGVVGPVPVGAPNAPDLSRASRRRAAEEAAAEQAATSRYRLLIVSGVVFGLVAAVFLVWAVFGRPRDNYEPAPAPTSTATGPIQPTVLIQVQDKDGVALANALLSVGGSVKRANVITVPQNVVLDVATGGTLPFGQIARLPDANSSANALSDAIGVNVTGTWAMNELAFSGLVDAVGGITADVDVDVIQTKSDGTRVILVSAGKAQVLQGPEATAYATYLAPGEPEEARMARFTQVLRLTVAKLPSDISKVESILTGLGASARSTVKTPVLAAFLVKLQAEVLVDNVAYQNLPVKPLPSGGASASTVDQVAAAAMVQELLPDAARKPGANSQVRVLVQNGVGTPGLNAAARQLLVDAGYTFINGGNAGSLGHATTQIVIPDSGVTSRKWGTDIATALKVPATDVVIDSSGQSVADVIVILGADFSPTSS